MKICMQNYISLTERRTNCRDLNLANGCCTFSLNAPLHVRFNGMSLVCHAKQVSPMMLLLLCCCLCMEIVGRNIIRSHVVNGGRMSMEGGIR